MLRLIIQVSGSRMSGTYPKDELKLTPDRVLHIPTGSITPHILLWALQACCSNTAAFPREALFLLRRTNDIALAQPFTIGWAIYLSTLEKIIFSPDPGPEASLWHENLLPSTATASGK